MPVGGPARAAGAIGLHGLERLSPSLLTTSIHSKGPCRPSSSSMQRSAQSYQVGFARFSYLASWTIRCRPCRRQYVSRPHMAPPQLGKCCPTSRPGLAALRLNAVIIGYATLACGDVALGSLPWRPPARSSEGYRRLSIYTAGTIDTTPQVGNTTRLVCPLLPWQCRCPFKYYTAGRPSRCSTGLPRRAQVVGVGTQLRTSSQVGPAATHHSACRCKTWLDRLLGEARPLGMLAGRTRSGGCAGPVTMLLPGVVVPRREKSNAVQC